MKIWASILAVFLTSAALPAEPAAQQPAGATVLLLPLKPIGDVGSHTWIAEAIEQNLVNELSRGQSVTSTILAKPAADVSTAAEALKAAGGTGASHVLFGSYQVNAAGLRITAQVLDMKTGKAIGSLKATGALRDLFSLEDEIAGQLKRLLMAATAAPAPAAQQGGAAPQANAFAIRPNGPLVQNPWSRDQDLINRAQSGYDYWANRYNYGNLPYWGWWPECYAYPGWTYGGIAYPTYFYPQSYRISNSSWYGLSARPMFPNHQGYVPVTAR